MSPKHECVATSVSKFLPTPYICSYSLHSHPALLTPCVRSQDPLGDGNQASTIALDIRKRKGLKPNPAPLNEYEDKL